VCIGWECIVWEQERKKEEGLEPDRGEVSCAGTHEAGARVGKGRDHSEGPQVERASGHGNTYLGVRKGQGRGAWERCRP